MNDWRERDGYYPSTQPCCVCGSTNQTGSEPRFNYVVCEEHSKLSPVEVGERKKNSRCQILEIGPNNPDNICGKPATRIYKDEPHCEEHYQEQLHYASSLDGGGLLTLKNAGSLVFRKDLK